jgi:hypothetical protein
MYHIVLAVLWHNADSKAGIEQYYTGINEIFTGFGLPMVDIPDGFSTSLFTHDDIDIADDGVIEGDDFNYILAVIYYANNKMHISTQDYTDIYIPCSVNFPDCGEVALRNFIQILITRDSKFDLTLLEKYGAIKSVKEYFKYFDSNLRVSNDYIGTDCFKEMISPLYEEGIRLKSRDAWGLVVSNLGADIRYQNMCETDSIPYHYEILDGLAQNSKDVSNMLAIIRRLFTNIKKWEDFNDDIVEVENNLDKKGYGDVYVSNSSLGDYTMKFIARHYEFLCNAVKALEIVKEFEGEDMVYLTLLNSHDFHDENFVKYITKNGTSDYWIYYLMRDDNYMVDIINSCWFFISVETYKKLVDYTYIHFDSDKFARTDIHKPLLSGKTYYEYTDIYFMNVLKSLYRTSVTDLVIKPIYECDNTDFDFSTLSDISQLTSLTIEIEDVINIYNIDRLVNLVKFEVMFYKTGGWRDELNCSSVTTEQLKDLNKLNKLCIHTLVIEGDTTILERLEILEVNEFEYTYRGALKSILPNTRVKTLHVGSKLCREIYSAEIGLPSVEVFSMSGSIKESDKLFRLLPNIKAIRGGSFAGDITCDLPNLIEISNVADIEPFIKYLPQLEVLILNSLRDGEYLRNMPKLKKLGFAHTYVEQLYTLKDIPLIDLDISGLYLLDSGIRDYDFKEISLTLPTTLMKLCIKGGLSTGRGKRPTIYISDIPNITHITVHGYELMLLPSKDDSVPISHMYLKAVDVPDIELFITGTNTSINDVCFQDSDASNIDSVLSKLPNLTHISLPATYYSEYFTPDESPLDTCTELEVIKFYCKLEDNMEYLGNHLEKLKSLREIYFYNGVSNKVFNHLPAAIKKLIMHI